MGEQRRDVLLDRLADVPPGVLVFHIASPRAAKNRGFVSSRTSACVPSLLPRRGEGADLVVGAVAARGVGRRGLEAAGANTGGGGLGGPGRPPHVGRVGRAAAGPSR